MGKTAVFVLSILHQIQPIDGQVSALVMTHTRELAVQIKKEFDRFKKYLTSPGIKVEVITGGLEIGPQKDVLRNNTPNIVVGTPGRISQLSQDGSLNLKNIKFFVLDECDKVLETADMRQQMQESFRKTPHDKQVMMFSATFSSEARKVAKKFMQDEPLEIYIDDASKLSLDALLQYYVKIEEKGKITKLMEILDMLDFNQVIIFVRSKQRCTALAQQLEKANFPTEFIHAHLKQADRNKRFQDFKDFKFRILLSTELLGRGVDFEKVNVVVNFDMPADSTSYLHRVARAGRFGTKGVAISFITSEEDQTVLNDVQSKYVSQIPEMPAEIPTSSYSS
jgi:superfamily II DNA/RNA helicase